MKAHQKCDAPMLKDRIREDFLLRKFQSPQKSVNHRDDKIYYSAK